MRKTGKIKESKFGNFLFPQDTQEIISNPNGYAIKFASGLMICARFTGEFATCNLQTSIGGTTVYYNNMTWTFPEPFTEVYIVIGNSLDYGAGVSGLCVNTLTNTAATMEAYAANGFKTGFSAIAIGRWK